MNCANLIRLASFCEPAVAGRFRPEMGRSRPVLSPARDMVHHDRCGAAAHSCRLWVIGDGDRVRRVLNNAGPIRRRYGHSAGDGTRRPKVPPNVRVRHPGRPRHHDPVV